MGLALRKSDRVFALHLRCSNCRRETVQELYSGEGGPSDVDELIESGLLNEVRYLCVQCESVIGHIVAIT